jgi:general secretion pathway protein A
MYNNFFGFKEKPFKLVPNPAYLFLSKCHEEALAHLNYAISQGDGFVQITGEVGTGKTTLCRAFIESLNGRTKAAYIFNPKLGPKQLVMAINDEFGIRSNSETTKDLIDNLNTFLMQSKAEGNRVILLIDEAQNLARNVLEQLRLLSNLETNKDKLLQIVLVGQPELSELLESRELRQLGQRITLSYHLTPLSFKETREYIQFRINIAAQRKGIQFDRSAYRQIFKYSKGIPRLINIACDRALLTAFVLNQHKITGSISKTSIRELSGRRTLRKYELGDGRKSLMLIAFLSIALFVGIYHQPMIKGLSTFFSSLRGQGPESLRPVESALPSFAGPAHHQKAADGTETNAANDQAGRPTVDLADYLKNMDVQASRYHALQQVLTLWRADTEIKDYLKGIDDAQDFFRLALKPCGLSIQKVEGDMDLLKKLNLPAILEAYPPGSASPGYLTLSKIDGEKILLGGSGDNDLVVTDLNGIEFFWSGVAYIPWKNYLSIWGTIPTQSYKDSIITLKLLLQDIGFKNFEINDDYDDQTQKAIEQLQTKYGLPVDGFVGPLTKIILYREKNAFDMPRLIEERTED